MTKIKTRYITIIEIDDFGFEYTLRCTNQHDLMIAQYFRKTIKNKLKELKQGSFV